MHFEDARSSSRSAVASAAADCYNAKDISMLGQQ
jgi:hypothetical protein